jgi:hypothetical protein
VDIASVAATSDYIYSLDTEPASTSDRVDVCSGASNCFLSNLRIAFRTCITPSCHLSLLDCSKDCSNHFRADFESSFIFEKKKMSPAPPKRQRNVDKVRTSRREPRLNKTTASASSHTRALPPVFCNKERACRAQASDCSNTTGVGVLRMNSSERLFINCAPGDDNF